MAEAKKISIILVSYNSWFWLEQCLSSFHFLTGWSEKEKDSAFEVILVDNSSSDGTVEKIKKLFPWVKIVALTENRGFSGGNNVGIQHATAPFICLLNTDTEFVKPTNFLSLLRHFEQDSQIAVVTPKVLLANGTIDHACHRGFPTPWNAFCYFTSLAKRFPKVKLFSGYEQTWKDLTTEHEVDACTGAAMIVRASSLPEVGLLDEAYFMYAEDIDWCYRFVEQGWKVWYDPSETVIHHKHKSGLGGQKIQWETKVRTVSAFYDTMKQFFRKHYTTKYPRLVLWIVFAMIELLKRRKIYQERKKYVQS